MAPLFFHLKGDCFLLSYIIAYKEAPVYRFNQRKRYYWLDNDDCCFLPFYAWFSIVYVKVLVLIA